MDSASFYAFSLFVLLNRRLARPELVGVKKKIDRREAKREAKALSAAKLERSIEAELLSRLKSKAYGDAPLNVNEAVWKAVLENERLSANADADEADQLSLDEYDEEEEEMEEGREFVSDDSELEGLEDDSDMEDYDGAAGFDAFDEDSDEAEDGADNEDDEAPDGEGDSEQPPKSSLGKRKQREPGQPKKLQRSDKKGKKRTYYEATRSALVTYSLQVHGWKSSSKRRQYRCPEMRYWPCSQPVSLQFGCTSRENFTACPHQMTGCP